MAVLRFFDVVLVVVAAPIMLLIGVPAGRLPGRRRGLDRAARGRRRRRARAPTSTPDASRQITIRMGFMLGRLFLLALAVILARQSTARTTA